MSALLNIVGLGLGISRKGTGHSDLVGNGLKKRKVVDESEKSGIKKYKSMSRSFESF
jgi:hypothetical protein